MSVRQSNVFMDWANVDLNSLLPESGRSEFEVDVSKWTTMPVYMYPPRPPRLLTQVGFWHGLGLARLEDFFWLGPV